MSNDWYDDATVKKHIREIAEVAFKDLQRELPERIAGNKFRMPPLMREWMEKEAPMRGGVDNYYVVTVGYGYNALSCHFTFREDDITMEFRLPNGTRLFILELIKLWQGLL